MAKKKSNSTTPIDTVKHKDKRVNIPTEELRDFVKEDEAKPKKILYPRDTSLDPQLVWKGKDEQDAADLAVPAVPVYIQEKIHPQVIIENVRAEAKKDKPEMQASLFADFNGIKFEDLIEFYQHDQNWSNRMILGDSLLVMTSLAEKEGLKGKVQMIYIDPPYGIKFDSNWQVSTRDDKVADGKFEGLTRQPEQIRAFRDTWKLGIHSYLAYLRDRLVIARELLTETGSVFVQIGDENVHLVRSLMDEVLGSENFVAIIRFRKKTMPLGAIFLERMGDFIIWYAKDVNAAKTKYRQIFIKQNYEEDFHWNNYELPDGTRVKLTEAQISDGQTVPKDAKRFRLVSLWPASYNANAVFPVKYKGKEWWPAEGQCWPTSPEAMQKLVWANQIEPEGKYLRKVLYLEGAEYAKLTTDWADTIGARDKNYVVETSPNVIERCLLMTTDPGDLVLDPTCGSGTTAYVAEQWGRRWITIDTSRVALALARTRLMAAKYPYYFLADSQEGVKKDMEVTGKIPPFPPLEKGGGGGIMTKGGTEGGGISYKTEGDIKKGFVYKRVPHVTLKSIANNPDIKEGMKRAEIDAAIARHAETETLYDQPYEDNKRIRVTGPFTVESLSPHRVLATDEERPASEKEAQKTAGVGQFETMILDNLMKAGVQNTVKNERLKFDRLEPYAGEWLHFAGEYNEKGGVSKRVAVCIGPEHGTVGQELIKEAAKEAVRGAGFDLLVICGFAFDASANEAANQFKPEGKKPSDKIVAESQKQYGKLPILLARMNPDLAMGEELLKKTGAGNLFMVFGEPDIIVCSEQWLVSSSGRKVVQLDRAQKLSGLEGLAEINRMGGSDLQRLKDLSAGRAVRPDQSDKKGGGVGSSEHSRRLGKDDDGGVPSVSGDSQGLAGGSGNTADSLGAPRISADGATGHAAITGVGNREDARRVAALSAIKALTPSDFPLSTTHCTQLTILGVDVYDPTTGQIRSSSTDDIACWFIDTNYNGESFFVRHAYFLGADEPYEKLKRALRAEVDESAWSMLYASISQPFENPITGKIAVKVINHYGDEVLKVYEVK